MAHIAHQPGPVCLEGGVSRWLVGVVGLGAELHLHLRPHTRRVGRFFNSSGLVKRAVPRPSAPGAEGLAVQEENHSCARGQVVIARPPVLTPPWRYRRSVVSKGRFAIFINVICVGIRSSLPKRRYRVVIDYEGDLLRHRGKV
jgi:hypothetical protein